MKNQSDVSCWQRFRVKLSPYRSLRIATVEGKIPTPESGHQINLLKPLSNGSSVQFPKRWQAIHELHRLQAHRNDALE